jgi:hypothetical protein
VQRHCQRAFSRGISAPLLLRSRSMAKDIDIVAALAVTAVVVISGLWRLIG